MTEILLGLIGLLGAFGFYQKHSATKHKKRADDAEVEVKAQKFIVADVTRMEKVKKAAKKTSSKQVKEGVEKAKSGHYFRDLED